MIKKLFLLITVLCILFFSLYKNNDNLLVYFLDVGQGDAILIRTPQGQNILIDGGPDNALLYRLADKLPWWERTIDYLAISHYHADHYVGLIDLLEKYKVKNILVTANQLDDYLYKLWLEKLAEKNIEPIVVKAGEKFIAGSDINWQVLLADSNHKDLNENSLVIKLTYKEIDFLFMGDLATEGEEKLLNSGFDLTAEVLKVGHHGSKYSSSEDFLKAVSPKICVIQSGKDNKFGHPHQEALSRLYSAGCWVMDNQNLGNIEIFSNGFDIIY